MAVGRGGAFMATEVAVSFQGCLAPMGVSACRIPIPLSRTLPHARDLCARSLGRFPLHGKLEVSGVWIFPPKLTHPLNILLHPIRKQMKSCNLWVNWKTLLLICYQCQRKTKAKMSRKCKDHMYMTCLGIITSCADKAT
jgi:hypothetical protein